MGWAGDSQCGCLEKASPSDLEARVGRRMPALVPSIVLGPQLGCTLSACSASAHFSNAHVNACFDRKKRQCYLNLGVIRVLPNSTVCVCIHVLFQDCKW